MTLAQQGENISEFIVSLCLKSESFREKFNNRGQPLSFRQTWFIVLFSSGELPICSHYLSAAAVRIHLRNVFVKLYSRVGGFGFRLGEGLWANAQARGQGF